MKVNLLPRDQNAKKSTSSSGGFNLKKLILTFSFLCIALIAGILFINQQAAAFKKQLTDIQSGWGSTEPLLKEKTLLNERKAKLSSFLSLLKESFQSDISWADKLAVLPDFLTEEVWLKEISLNKESASQQQYVTMDIMGSVGYLSRDEELLAKINNFVDNIKRDTEFFKDFGNLSLLDIRKSNAMISQGSVMDFKITLSSKSAQ